MLDEPSPGKEPMSLFTRAIPGVIKFYIIFLPYFGAILFCINLGSRSNDPFGLVERYDELNIEYRQSFYRDGDFANDFYSRVDRFTEEVYKYTVTLESNAKDESVWACFAPILYIVFGLTVGVAFLRLIYRYLHYMTNSIHKSLFWIHAFVITGYFTYFSFSSEIKLSITGGDYLFFSVYPLTPVYLLMHILNIFVLIFFAFVFLRSKPFSSQSKEGI